MAVKRGSSLRCRRRVLGGWSALFGDEDGSSEANPVLRPCGNMLVRSSLSLSSTSSSSASSSSETVARKTEAAALLLGNERSNEEDDGKREAWVVIFEVQRALNETLNEKTTRTKNVT